MISRKRYPRALLSTSADRLARAESYWQLGALRLLTFADYFIVLGPETGEADFRRTVVDVDDIVEYTPHMEIVQIVLDEGLLQAADRAARRTRTNRSALVRDALREYLRRLDVQAKEERDRRGYSRKPHARDEALAWETEAAWPRE